MYIAEEKTAVILHTNNAGKGCCSWIVYKPIVVDVDVSNDDIMCADHIAFAFFTS